MTGIMVEAELWVKAKLASDFSGHDWWHIDRVRRSALTIAREEGADSFVCELAALLHDMADEKLFGNEEEGFKEIESWLLGKGLQAEVAEAIIEIIATMSFKGGSRPPMRTLEGKVVQDADRLDAIGAVGISRVFAYSGAKHRPIHDPAIAPRGEMTAKEYRSGNDTAINHFYEKLLKLKDLMNTDYGRRMAEERHRFMEQYLDRFHQEWSGDK
jgi:uncharacterized protein